MFFMRALALLFLFPLSLQALLFSNPAQPALQPQGILESPRDWYCLRLGYVCDFVYRQDYKEEFTPDRESMRSKLKTDAAIVILNIKNSVDFNIMVGSSQIQLDQKIFTKSQFAWACGTKILFYQTPVFSLAFDFKYLGTKQKPYYIVAHGYAHNIVSKLCFDYFEAQAALGIAVKAAHFFPYLYVSYLTSKVVPIPSAFLLKKPRTNQRIEKEAHPMICERLWGIALGTTLLARTEGSLTVETRLFNQNATTITGEFRF